MILLRNDYYKMCLIKRSIIHLNKPHLHLYLVLLNMIIKDQKGKLIIKYIHNVMSIHLVIRIIIPQMMRIKDIIDTYLLSIYYNI